MGLKEDKPRLGNSGEGRTWELWEREGLGRRGKGKDLGVVEKV